MSTRFRGRGLWHLVPGASSRVRPRGGRRVGERVVDGADPARRLACSVQLASAPSRGLDAWHEAQLHAPARTRVKNPQTGISDSDAARLQRRQPLVAGIARQAIRAPDQWRGAPQSGATTVPPEPYRYLTVPPCTPRCCVRASLNPPYLGETRRASASAANQVLDSLHRVDRMPVSWLT